MDSIGVNSSQGTKTNTLPSFEKKKVNKENPKFKNNIEIKKH